MLQCRLNIGAVAFAKVFFGQADFHAFERFVQIAGVVFFFAFEAGGVFGVETCHRV